MAKPRNSPPSRLQSELHQKKSFHSASQEGAIGIVRTADLLRRRFSRLVEPHGISGQQYNVLRILRGARPEALPTLTIAERMIERAPGITRLLDRLERKGLVQRERCASDRRQVLCEITRKGLQLLETLDRPIGRADDEALAGISDADLNALIRILDAVREHHT
jgi:DNA-binding MarR family transcriptional regulator